MCTVENFLSELFHALLLVLLNRLLQYCLYPSQQASLRRGGGK